LSIKSPDVSQAAAEGSFKTDLHGASRAAKRGIRSTGEKPMENHHDFVITHRGNLFALRPLTLPADQYAHEFLPRNSWRWIDGALEFSPAEFVDIVRGIQSSNLTVGGGVA
jgi:hypothetical protein